MASIPQRRPRQRDIQQLALPLATAPPRVQFPAATTSPSLHPAAVWPTLSPAQQAQARQRILGVVEEVLREVGSHD
jgi:hypothetical protein